MKLSSNFTELSKNDMEQVSGGFLINLILDICPLLRVFRPPDGEPGKPEDDNGVGFSLASRIFGLFTR